MTGRASASLLLLLLPDCPPLSSGHWKLPHVLDPSEALATWSKNAWAHRPPLAADTRTRTGFRVQ